MSKCRNVCPYVQSTVNNIMIKINALNDGSSAFFTNSEQGPFLATKEALEEEARTLYREALQLQKEGKLFEAKGAFCRLLDSPVVKEATKRNEKEDLSARPGLTLKYLANKNLAAIAQEQGDDQATMEAYLQAVAIDATDVSVWFKMGLVAQKLQNYVMARLFFLEGLQCNSSHWPCLDRLISVLYALNDYQNCLEHIARALEKDPSYCKGLFFRDQIYREQPSLRLETTYLFKLCDPTIYTETYEEEDVTKFLDECLTMREKIRQLCKPKPLPVVTFRNAFTEFTWKGLGDNMIILYDYMRESDPPLSIACRVDLSQCSEGTDAMDSSVLTSSFSSSSEACASEVPTQCVEPDQSKSEDLPGEDVCLGALQAENILLGDFCSQKGAKRKRLSTDSSEWNFKRRSTRVRNTMVKKPTEVVDYRQLLFKFLPSTLVREVKDDDFEEGAELQVDVPTTDHTYGQVLEEGRRELPESVDLLSRTEAEDVKVFIQSFKQNVGILQLMRYFMEQLTEKSALLWPSGLGDTYVAVYERFRKHVPHPNMFSAESLCESVARQAWFTLVYDELKMDRWQLARRGMALDFPGFFFPEDLDFLSFAATRTDLFADRWRNFAIRALWVKMKQHVIEGEVQVAVACLNRVEELLSPTENEEEEALQIYLTNCLTGNFITASHARELLDSLRRCQSLEEVHQLYEQQEYRTVADLLMATFAQPQPKRQAKEDGSVPERQVQLFLLQDSLWKLCSYQECLHWGEAAFNEALQQYLARKDWGETIVRLLDGLNKCLEKSSESLAQLDAEQQLRLTHNLIRLVALQMDVAGAANCITPWIVLYRIVRHEEERLLKLAGPEETSGALTSSLMLLLTAHECLGRRSWCSAADGQLLLFIVEVLLDELHQPAKQHPHREELEMGLEQCFYCLYGHPNKRAKARHLQEHNAPQVSLTWERAQDLFNYFKPKVLPEFDSYRTSTVSSELEHLLRRISLLVPPEQDPNSMTEAVVGYVEGGTDKHPTVLPDQLQPSPLVKEVFYLLGDYYFKNKEFGKAVKFYTLDICSNPERLDSWAGMALSRSSQLEQKLTMFSQQGETKSDATVYRRASSALRCFRRALQLDPLHGPLWIEYGSMAYMLHGYASRQLKQRKQLNLADDVVELLTNKKEEMLNTAEHCFKSAKQCREGRAELWLHHYMLGKIGEKRGMHPKEFLPQYTLAAQYLHEDGAAYPKRILYHGPPELSIEALEVYYRMHASVLKYMYGENLVHLHFVKEYLREVSQGHFACCLENRELYSSDESSSVSTCTPTKKKVVKSDHDYLDDWQRKEDLAIQELLDWIVAEVAETSLKESVRDSLQRLADEGGKADVNDRDVAEIEERCLAAMEECHQRFAQHYKALYRLAHFYCFGRRQDLKKSREILLGIAGTQQPGLFAERKNTNFFNGIWRIPVDEIDRPGSFSVHMYRSMVLLIEVLRQQNDHGMLLHLTLQLSRTPEPGKRYLRDFDRLHLSRECFTLCLGLLRAHMDRLLSEEPPPEESRLIECLLNIYRSWQTLQKNGVFPDEASEMLEEAYAMYRLGEVDTSPPILEQAARFCQEQIQNAGGQSESLSQNSASTH